MANVVVLEDDRIVRNLIALILRQQRHVVWQASNPEDAGRLCDEHAINLLVADVKLSEGRSGPEFARRLVQVRPQVKCVFISGLPFEDWSARDARHVTQMRDDSYTILCKPIAPENLLKVVGELLPRVQPAKQLVQAARADPWVSTMRDLLNGIRCWLEKGKLDIELWNLYTATAHVCLEEMKAVADSKGESEDDVCVYVSLAIPHVASALQALKSRDRQAALTSVTDAVSILTSD